MEAGAHHRPDGGFRNPWASARTHGFLDFLKWTLVERRRGRGDRKAEPRTFPRAVSSFVFPRADPGVLTITWDGHSTFLIQVGGLNLLLDPIWSDRASPLRFMGPRRRVPPAVDFDDLPPIDVVILSHDHYDHLDAWTVKRLIRRYPAIAWFAPLGVGAFCARAEPVTWWNPIGGRSLPSARCALRVSPLSTFQGDGSTTGTPLFGAAGRYGRPGIRCCLPETPRCIPSSD